MKFDRSSLLLYAVTDSAWTGELSLLEQIELAIRGGATMVQLREKDMPQIEMIELARAARGICAKGGVPFIVNDSLEAALACGADGVHVGQSDAPAREIRAAAGADLIIGVSASTVDEAKRALSDGADYIGIGAIHPTGTKSDADVVPLDTVRAITREVDIPACAIGGIKAGNIAELAGLGLDGAAVVSAIFAAHDIETSTRELRALAERTFSKNK